MPRLQLNLRLANQAQMALIKFGATRDGKSVSAFVLGAALSAATRHPYLTPVDFEAVGQVSRELRAVGINVNQVAYNLNRLANGDDRVRIDEGEVAEIQGRLNKVLDDIQAMLSRWTHDEL